MVVEKRSCTGVQRASQTASATRSRFFERPLSEQSLEGANGMADINTTQLRDALAWATGGEDATHNPSSNPFVWFWEAVEGDFNEDRSTGQILMDAAISMIPLVDQLCDVRDLIANCRKLYRDHTDGIAWIALALTLIGLFPTLGSLVKGVLKIFFAFLRRAGGKEVEAAVDGAMTWVITFLRRRDVQKYLSSHKVDEVFKWLANEVKAVHAKVNLGALLAAFDGAIKVVDGLVQKVSFIPSLGNKAKQVLVEVRQIRMKADAGLAQALKPVQDMIGTVILKLEKEVLEKQRGIVDVRNVHYRGVLPEAAAIALMRKRKPKWLTQNGSDVFPRLEPQVVGSNLRPYTAPTSPNGQRRPKKDIFPPLTDQNIRSFHTIAAHTIRGPARLYRIISPNSRAMSDCWVSEEIFKQLQKSPDPRAAWRKFLAVWPDWNANGQFVIYDVRVGESLNVWRGIASSQKKGSLPDCQLEGGWEQIVFNISRKDTRNDKVLYYKQGNGKNPKLSGPFDQKQIDVMTSKMNPVQKRRFFESYTQVREQINHPNISGPFSTGWGYTDFDGAGMASKVGLPALQGQVTNLAR
jgi:hypothetical protein